MGATWSDSTFIQDRKVPRLGDMDLRCKEPSHDPHEGFDYQRKPREQIATFQEMEAAKLPMPYRDYCAHLLLAFESCRKRSFPFGWKCHHEKHALDMCRFDDYVLRMKEYERERRLDERAARLPEEEQ